MGEVPRVTYVSVPNPFTFRYVSRSWGGTVAFLAADWLRFGKVKQLEVTLETNSRKNHVKNVPPMLLWAGHPVVLQSDCKSLQSLFVYDKAYDEIKEGHSSS